MLLYIHTVETTTEHIHERERDNVGLSLTLVRVTNPIQTAKTCYHSVMDTAATMKCVYLVLRSSIAVSNFACSMLTDL